MLRVFMRVPGVDRIDFRGVHNQRTPVDSRAHHPTCAYVSDSGESVTQDAFFILCLSVSGESDIWSVRNMFCMSVSGELDM